MTSENWAATGDDEWELMNDDGFVYKRKKDPNQTTAASPPDPAAEEKNRLTRKKNVLTIIKQKYEKEIEQWEHLSNTLKDMKHKAENINYTERNDVVLSCELSSQSSDLSRRVLIDQLISEAEAQEFVIHNVSSLCDVAEALCSAQEERVKESFMDLPVWEQSPRELIKSLCEE